MAEVTNPTPPRTSIASGRNLIVSILVLVALAAGAVAGYYYSDQRSNDEIASLQTQAARATLQARYVKERIYVDDRHGFTFVVPKHWVKSFTAVVNQTSTMFIFRQPERLYQPVITVYKCKATDYEQLKGQTTDEAKCPGQLIKQSSSNAYTWKANDKKHTFIDTLGDTDKVIKDWQELVLPTFQIVD